MVEGGRRRQVWCRDDDADRSGMGEIKQSRVGVGGGETPRTEEIKENSFRLSIGEGVGTRCPEDDTRTNPP